MFCGVMLVSVVIVENFTQPLFYQAGQLRSHAYLPGKRLRFINFTNFLPSLGSQGVYGGAETKAGG